LVGLKVGHWGGLTDDWMAKLRAETSDDWTADEELVLQLDGSLDSVMDYLTVVMLASKKASSSEPPLAVVRDSQTGTHLDHR
jgi:hypothetical protein